MTITVGVSLKMYFGHARALAWCRTVAELVRQRPAVGSGAVELIVLPTFPSLLPVIAVFGDASVTVGAQDLHWADSGAFTGEVSGAELAEIGVGAVEIGHAERRRLFGESDAMITGKTAAALRHGLTPLLCVGEAAVMPSEQAIAVVTEQVRSALAEAPAGRVIIAYEPVWAIGADAPAPDDHVRAVCAALRTMIDSDRAGSSVIYGGAAGPGLFGRLGGATDGLFLGRFAHDPAVLAQVLDEAALVAAGGER